MQRPCFWALLAVVGGSQATASAALGALANLKNIDRVPESLKALLSGLEEEQAARTKVVREAKQYCEDTIQEKKDAGEDAADKMNEAQADIQEADSRLDGAKQRVTDIKGEIRAADGELSTIEGKYDEEKGKFKESLEELQQATGDVEKSVFMHHTAVRRSGDSNIDTLRSLDSDLLKDSVPPSFLQRNANDDAEARAEQVESAKEMEKAEAELRAEWAEKQEELGELLKNKKELVSQLETDLENAQLAYAQAQEVSASLKRTINGAERTKGRNEKILAGLEVTCEKQAGFYQVQEGLRTDAAAGLDEALGLLSTLQHSAMTQFVQADPSFVQLSQEPALLDLTVNAQTAISSAEGLDPLSDIKAKIQGMVQALEAAANAETGPANFCSQEQAKNREKKRSKTDDIDRQAAEARGKKFGLDALHAEQRSAQSGLNELSLLKAHIDNFATLEESRLDGMKKDHDLAVEVLDKAASLVKSEFGLTLLQVDPLSPQEMAGKAVSAMQKSNDAIRSLSANADDYLLKLQEGDQAVGGAVSEALRNEQQTLAASKSTEATMLDEISQAETSEQTARAELTVIETYLTNLGQQCGPQLGNSYEELKRQREEEIAALQDAIKVLEGESVPALSMAQVKNPTAVQRAALALGVA